MKANRGDLERFGALIGQAGSSANAAAEALWWLLWHVVIALVVWPVLWLWLPQEDPAERERRVENDKRWADEDF